MFLTFFGGSVKEGQCCQCRFPGNMDDNILSLVLRHFTCSDRNYKSSLPHLELGWEK